MLEYIRQYIDERQIDIGFVYGFLSLLIAIALAYHMLFMAFYSDVFLLNVFCPIFFAIAYGFFHHRQEARQGFIGLTNMAAFLPMVILLLWLIDDPGIIGTGEQRDAAAVIKLILIQAINLHVRRLVLAPLYSKQSLAAFATSPQQEKDHSGKKHC